MSDRKRSLDPKAPDAVVFVTKRRAALSQIEAAIMLWFNYGDPLPIHALAAAANEVYHGMGRPRGMPTVIQQWKKTATKADLKLANKTQNFAKHAYTDSNPDARIPVITELAELLILDSIMCHAKLFGGYTPLMRCFYGRFTVENPRILDTIADPVLRQEFNESLKVYSADKLSRVEHFNMMYPLLLSGQI
jgi:hypothetical protein